MGVIELIIILIVPVSVLITVIYLITANKLKKYHLTRKINDKWYIVERIATLASILSLWVAITAYLWSEHKKEEIQIKQYKSLISDFRLARNENLEILKYITSINGQLYLIIPNKLVYLDRYHVKQLIQNNMVSGSVRIINLIRLNTQLELLNEKIKLMKSFNLINAGMMETTDIVMRLGNINATVKEIQKLYKVASTDLGIEEK